MFTKSNFKRFTSLVLVFALLMTLFAGVISRAEATPQTVLNGKKILFTGDSIGAGWRDNDGVSDYTNAGGWAKRIGDDYGAEVTNAAVAGYALSTIRNSEGKSPIVTQLSGNKNNTYDYVVLQGGFNDAMGTNADKTKESAAPVGKITNSWDVEDYDTATFAGALENLFYYATEYFPTAKIGFIITYATPTSTYGGYTADVEAMREYWNIAKQICNKWDISYLDLFDGTASDGKSYSYDVLKVNTSNYFPGSGDTIHLNAAGYDAITPYIADWMASNVYVPSSHTVTWTDIPEITLDFEKDYLASDGSVYYNSTENISATGNGRGSNAKLVTLEDGTKAVRLTYDNDNGNENYNANSVMNIYNPATSSKFVGKSGTVYKITFDYKIENTDGQTMQFFISKCSRANGNPNGNNAFQSTDVGPKAVIPGDTTEFIPVTGKLDAATDGFVTVSAYYTAEAKLENYDVYPIIVLCTNDKNKSTSTTSNYASALVDNIEVAVSTQASDNLYSVNLGFEEDGIASYYNNTSENWSSNNGRGSKAELVTLDDGTKAVRLTYDNENGNENYNANAALNIYDPKTGSKFVGTQGTKYKITFDYKIENTDGRTMQFFLSSCSRTYGYPLADQCAFNASDMGPKAVIPNKETGFIAVTDKLNATTNGFVTVSAYYTAQNDVDNSGRTVYPIILLCTNDKSKDTSVTSNWASALIDNVKVEEVAKENADCETYLDFESTYYGADNTTVYYSGTTNMACDNQRGSNTFLVTESDGNKAMVLSYDNENNNYKENPAFNIYNSSTSSKFVGTSGKTYLISFDYKVTCTDDKALQLYLVTTGRSSLGGSDLNANATAMQTQNWKFTAVGKSITETSDEYTRAYVSYTADGTTYPIILLSTNNSTKDTTHNGSRPYAQVLIDNVKVEANQQAYITCRNYNGDSHETLKIFKDTKFSDLEVPTRKGYIFEGFYVDSLLTEKANDFDMVGNYNVIYAKWSGDGTIMAPNKVKDYTTVESVKSFNACAVDKSNFGSDITYVQNSMLESVGTALTSNFYGAYVFSADQAVTNHGEKLIIDNIAATSLAANTVMFYVELPDYELSGSDWALGLGDRGICVNQNSNWIWTNISAGNSSYSYSLDGKWVNSAISSDGVFKGLPTGYKGYIKIDLTKLTFQQSVDFNAQYMFNCVELKMNALGGDNGDMILGGIFYFPSSVKDSTVMKIGDLCYELSKSADAVVVNSYDVYNSTSSSFSTRYTGTAGKPAVKFVETETSAFWGTAPAGITTVSGKAETTTGYMTTYVNSASSIVMQPGVDTIMFYVEMPEFTASSTMAPLKLLDTVIEQSGTVQTLSFSNSIYSYADVNDASWKLARAGADGDLYNIPSGFKGYVKFDIKQFKNIANIKGIDFTTPYTVTKFELGFNHIGGDNGKLVIGGVYSVISDSIAPFIKNGISGEKFCFKAISGDFDCNGDYDTSELTEIRKQIIGNGKELSAAAALRAKNLDVTALVKANNVVYGDDTADIGVTTDNGVTYKNIFTDDIGSTNGATVYPIASTPENLQVIAANHSAYTDEKAAAFAAEINANTIGDFEKTGIDKMCHVSTFLYAKGNIYMSYYANTISAAESPQYQVARIAYAPEDKPSEKVILDVMQVGDDLYGHKVTGVYDTILMQKDDEPDNLYILWTASINGKYYRLYCIFNMETEEMGEIGVNRFKVGNTTNDFSSSGMLKAMATEGVGYKEFFSDIGIMQKLSSRIENGVKYYYTGTYSGNFTAIIKSKDLITWEYVAQPNEGANGTGFSNATKWENAVYVLNDKVYYYVRQHLPSSHKTYGSFYGILTAYDLKTGEWDKPILVEDCQSRSDFIEYNGGLYLFYAPTPASGQGERCHIGILKIDTNDLSKTSVVLQSYIGGSCFYPFIQYNSKGELCMSYTVSRQHIRLASFTLSKYLD